MSLNSKLHLPTKCSFPSDLGGLVQRSGVANTAEIQKRVQLTFQDLHEFERVQNQYAALSVRFEGAIAIAPSNPIFQPQSGSLVLIPLADQAGISTYFNASIQKIGALVSGVRPVVLTALDGDGNVLEQVSTEGEQLFLEVGSPKHILAQKQLQLKAQQIARVVLHSYAPFILTNFFFE